MTPDSQNLRVTFFGDGGVWALKFKGEKIFAEFERKITEIIDEYKLENEDEDEE